MNVEKIVRPGSTSAWQMPAASLAGSSRDSGRMHIGRTCATFISQDSRMRESELYVQTL